MKKAFNKIILSSILTSLLFVFLGIFLFFRPGIANGIVGYLLGTVIIISGVNSIVKFFINQNSLRFFDFELALGILSILLGILVIFNPLAITSILSITLGIYMVISSTIKIQYALELKRYNEDSWILTLVIAIVTLIMGIIVLLNPFSGQLLLTKVVGIFMIFYAILDIIECLLLKKDAKDFMKLLK